MFICDAIPGLCVDHAIRQVRIDLLSVIRIVFIKAIRDLLLVWNLPMKVSIHFFVLKDVGNLVVRRIIERGDRLTIAMGDGLGRDLIMTSTVVKTVIAR